MKKIFLFTILLVSTKCFSQIYKLDSVYSKNFIVAITDSNTFSLTFTADIGIYDSNEKKISNISTGSTFYGMPVNAPALNDSIDKRIAAWFKQNYSTK